MLLLPMGFDEKSRARRFREDHIRGSDKVGLSCNKELTREGEIGNNLLEDQVMIIVNTL